MTKPVPFPDDVYRTEPRRVALAARLLPSLRFYTRIVGIVVRASRKAKRGRYDTAAWCTSSLETIRALEEVGGTIAISGIDRIRGLDGPAVFIANHMSTLETFALPVIIASVREATFVVKQSLVEYPVFRHVMRSRDPITVGRKNPRDDLQAVLEGGAARLRAGISIVIFPQTTRSADFAYEQFNSIGVKLARKAGVPVVPVALKTDAWGVGRLLKDFGRIDPARTAHIAFGEPLRISGRGNEEHERVIDFITGMLREWKKEDETGRPA